MNEKMIRFFFIFGIAIALIMPAAAQVDTGALTGTVTDAEGLPLPGCEVCIMGPNIMGGRLVTMTSRDGLYRFPRIPLGVYTLEVQLDGFQQKRRENIKVAASGKLEVNFALEPARLSEEVSVTAEAPVIDQVKPNFNITVDAKTMDILPISRGGHATELANFNPGDERYGSTLGSGWYGNAYLLDGADATDVGGGDVWLRPNYETVEEVEYVYGGANAEYGDFSGSMVKMITKSGSNRYFGSVGLYFSNHNLTSRNTEDPIGSPWSRPSASPEPDAASISRCGTFPRRPAPIAASTYGPPSRSPICLRGNTSSTSGSGMS